MALTILPDWAFAARVGHDGSIHNDFSSGRTPVDLAFDNRTLLIVTHQFTNLLYKLPRQNLITRTNPSKYTPTSQ
jgi:hypothetical protein